MAMLFVDPVLPSRRLYLKRGSRQEAFTIEHNPGEKAVTFLHTQ